MAKYISLKELWEKYTEDPYKIPYQDLLKTIEWKIFRDEIEKRDGGKCQHCQIQRKIEKHAVTADQFIKNRSEGTKKQQQIFEEIKKINKLNEKEIAIITEVEFILPVAFIEEVNLEVHHLYYTSGKYPWEYTADAVITLCRKCHQEEHDERDVIFYYDKEMKESKTVTKCLRCNGSGYLEEYDYYKNGVCFNCNGWGLN